MISTKGRYALRVMLDLAGRETEDFVPLEEIASRQGLSKKYLESILRSLVKGKLLKGVRGKGGGYRLLRSPDEYTVGEILESAGETLAIVACLQEGAKVCEKRGSCLTLPMWEKLDGMVHDFFHGITLETLLHGKTLDGAS